MINPIEQDTESLISIEENSSGEYQDTVSELDNQQNNNMRTSSSINNDLVSKANQDVITKQPKTRTNLTSGLEPNIDVEPKTRFGHSCNNCKCCIFNYKTESQTEQGQSAT